MLSLNRHTTFLHGQKQPKNWEWNRHTAEETLWLKIVCLSEIGTVCLRERTDGHFLEDTQFLF